MNTSLASFLLAASAVWFLAGPAGLSAQPPAPAPPEAIESPPPPAAPPAATPPKSRRDKARDRTAARERGKTGDVLVNVFSDSIQAKDRASDAVIAVFGSATADGQVQDAVVAVFGNTRVTGTVGEAAVAVLGDVFVNGKVQGNVVAILGDVELGPEAEVAGQIVCIGGRVRRDALAVVGGKVENIQEGRLLAHRDGLKAWIRQCLLRARPLAFGPNLGWAWALAGSILAFSAALALLFRGAVEQCIQTVDARPGASAVAALLTVFLTPVAMILLIVTGVGILLVPALAAALFFSSLFGATAVLAWVGRKATRPLGSAFGHPALAVLLAGTVMLGLYTIPVVGFLLMKLISWLGMGVVALTVLLAIKRSRPARAAAVPVAVAADSGVAAPPVFAAGVVDAPATPPVMAPAPVPPLSTALPRAGFWIRVAALLLDLLLFGLLAALLRGGPQLALLGVAAYAAVLWKLKGSTVGGIVCGLKVIRLDDRPLDWPTAVVRVFGCFLSLAAAGLGFIWVAIDAERQSWHDKIAGTTVVRMPRGVSLV